MIIHQPRYQAFDWFGKYYCGDCVPFHSDVKAENCGIIRCEGCGVYISSSYCAPKLETTLSWGEFDSNGYVYPGPIGLLIDMKINAVLAWARFLEKARNSKSKYHIEEIESNLTEAVSGNLFMMEYIGEDNLLHMVIMQQHEEFINTEVPRWHVVSGIIADGTMIVIPSDCSGEYLGKPSALRFIINHHVPKVVHYVWEVQKINIHN